MFKKTFLKEKLKDAAIILLSVLAVFLISQTLLFSNDSMNWLKSAFAGGSDSIIGSYGEQSESTVTIEPFSIVTTSELGSHYAMKYSSDTRLSAYSVFSASLAEALGTAYSRDEISIEEFFEAFKNTGVFFDFPYPVPLSILADTLRTDIAEKLSDVGARRIYISTVKSNSYLYYIDSETGTFYKCSTSMSSSHFTSKIAEFPLGEDVYVFESAYSNSELDPFFTISQTVLSMPSITSQISLLPSSRLDTLLAAFDISARAYTTYTETDGSTAYVDANKTLKINTAGDIVFAAAGDSGISFPEYRLAAENTNLIISKASALAKSCITTTGDAILVFGGITESAEENSYTVYFDYSLCGSIISFSDGSHAAEIEISNGSVVHANFKCRSYLLSGGFVYPLPDKQIVAASLLTGGEPVLKYMDSSQGVNLSWYRN